ncbi:hypothetical protein L195_g051328, partial [Trifolium pratense]
MTKLYSPATVATIGQPPEDDDSLEQFARTWCTNEYDITKLSKLARLGKGKEL